jgi:hypothetical protein
MLGIPRIAPDPDLALSALSALAEAARSVLLLPTRKGGPELTAVNGALTPDDASGIAAAHEAARFTPGDLPYYRIAPIVDRELVLPVLTGQKRPEQAANDAQRAVDLAIGEFERGL